MATLQILVLSFWVRVPMLQQSLTTKIKNIMVSKELEDAAKSYAIEMYRTTRNELLAEKCKWAFISGARFEQRQEVVPSKELADEIDALSKRYPEVSFAKLSRIAVRIAKWQKEQDKKLLNIKGV